MPASMGKQSVEIDLLGRFQVRVSGVRLAGDVIAGRKAPALLKLLALDRGHRLVRDEALELLWPTLDGPGGAAQLYKALHQLRRAFATAKQAPDAGEWIATSRDLVTLEPPDGVVTDVEAFEQTARDAIASGRLDRLERAAALYTGDLLPTDPYAAWTQAARDRLRQLYIDVLLELGEGYRKRGDLAAAAETCRTALQKDATLERAHRGLMAVFAQQGQRDRALKQYGVCIDVLADELGVAPSQETRALYARIERQAPGAEREPGRDRSNAPIPAAPLVGRDAECRIIDACLDRLPAKQGGVLFFEGQAGIGKTRLVRELVVRARLRGFDALVGSAYEMEAAIAYGPFIEVLEAALRDSPAGRERIPAEIAPLVSGGPRDAQPVPNSDPRAAQTYLFAAIAEFLRHRALSTPLAVVLENLHVAEQGSLELFHFLARRLQDVPLLLAATWRDEGAEAGEAFRRFLRSVGEIASVSALALPPLNAADHHELLRQQGGGRPPSREQSDEIYRLSEGNPMYALELHVFRSRHPPPGTADSPLAGTIPPSLRQSIAGRLEKLPAAARELLTIAAVVGEDVAYPLLESVWSDLGKGRDGAHPELLDLLDRLSAAQLLEERGVHFRFRHTLHRGCVYESASEARRRALHALVARSLVQLGEREDDLAVERIAFHYKRAGDARQAAHFLMLAGQRAASMYAHDEALHRYREALQMLEPAGDPVVMRICGNLHSLIGDTCRAAGRLGDSFSAYERAMSLTEGLSVNQTELTQLHYKIGLLAIFTNDMQKAGRHLAEAWRAAGNDPRTHARLHILRALYLWHFNRLEEAAQYAHRALDLAESADADLESAQACEMLAMAYLPLGRWQDGLRYEKRRLRHGRWSPELVVATDAHLCLWEYHLHDDHLLNDAAVFMRQVSEEADRLGDMRCVAICQYALGTIHLWQGDTSAALAELDASLALHDKVGSPAGMAYALVRRAVLHTMQDAVDLGWRSVQRGIELAERASIRDHCLQRLFGVGIWNRLQANDGKEVDELVSRSESLLAANGACTACSLDLYPWLALYHLERGEVDRAVQCAECTERLVMKTGNPVGETVAAIVRSGAERARGDVTRFGDARRRAVEAMRGAALGGSGSPLTYLFDRMTGAH